MAATYWCTTRVTGYGSSDASSEANRMPLEDFLADVESGTIVPDNGYVLVNVKADVVRTYNVSDIPASPARTFFLNIPNKSLSYIHYRAYTTTPGDGGIAVYRAAAESPQFSGGFMTFLGTATTVEGFCAFGQGVGNGFHVTASVSGKIINSAAVGWVDGFYNSSNPIVYVGCYSLSNSGDGFRAADDARYINCMAIDCGAYGYDFDDGADGDTSVAMNCLAEGCNIGYRLGTTGVVVRCAAMYNVDDGFSLGGRLLYGCVAGGNGGYGLGASNAFAVSCDFAPDGHANVTGDIENLSSVVSVNSVDGEPAFVRAGTSPLTGNDYTSGSTSDYADAGYPIGGSLALRTLAIAG